MTAPMRALPGIAAAGGMAVPALIYAAFNWGDPNIHGHSHRAEPRLHPPGPWR